MNDFAAVNNALQALGGDCSVSSAVRDVLLGALRALPLKLSPRMELLPSPLVV